MIPWPRLHLAPGSGQFSCAEWKSPGLRPPLCSLSSFLLGASSAHTTPSGPCPQPHAGSRSSGHSAASQPEDRPVAPCLRLLAPLAPFARLPRSPGPQPCLQSIVGVVPSQHVLLRARSGCALLSLRSVPQVPVQTLRRLGCRPERPLAARSPVWRSVPRSPGAARPSPSPRAVAVLLLSDAPPGAPPPGPGTLGPSASPAGVCLSRGSPVGSQVPENRGCCYSSPSPGLEGEDDLAGQRSTLSPGLSVLFPFLFVNCSFHFFLKHLLQIATLFTECLRLTQRKHVPLQWALS